jgi:PAS domain-containing protein
MSKSKRPLGHEEAAELRARAIERLSVAGARREARFSSAEAFHSLYELVLTPATAPRALALLHELQVHQVEIDLQNEELQRSRAALEMTLHRQAELYDQSPAALYTVDGNLALKELNLTGARLLGGERDTLIGRHLDAFITLESARALMGVLTRLAVSSKSEACTLQFADVGGPSAMLAVATADCIVGQFLIALLADPSRAAR